MNAPVSVNIYEAKTQLSRLVSRAESGEEIVIARHGRPVARLTRWEAPAASRTPGAWKGRMRMAADFDTLSDADIEDWYGDEKGPSSGEGPR